MVETRLGKHTCGDRVNAASLIGDIDTGLSPLGVNSPCRSVATAQSLRVRVIRRGIVGDGDESTLIDGILSRFAERAMRFSRT